jgi:hypothetical protein
MDGVFCLWFSRFISRRLTLMNSQSYVELVETLRLILRTSARNSLNKLTLPARESAHAKQNDAVFEAGDIRCAVSTFTVTDRYLYNF